jgi:broad specificity phosphatase PhoE
MQDGTPIAAHGATGDSGASGAQCLADDYGHCVLLLVRHGETMANVDGRVLGRADPPLTDRGVAQARALADALPAPNRVIASPLRRALDTARALCPTVEVDQRWIELDYGELDGRSLSSTPAEMWDRLRSDPSAAPEGGEPLAMLGRRVREACVDLMRDAAAGVVVVVTHVSPIKAAVAWALAASDEVAWRMFVEDASITRLDMRPAGPVLRWFNRLPPAV